MSETPDYERPLTVSQRKQVAKWLLICITAFSLLLGASAFTPNGIIIGLILAIPGFPLVLLCFGYLPLGGVHALWLFSMAPWLVLGLPGAAWGALKLTQNRTLPSIAFAALFFSVWSSIVQLSFFALYLT